MPVQRSRLATRGRNAFLRIGAPRDGANLSARCRRSLSAAPDEGADAHLIRAYGEAAPRHFANSLLSALGKKVSRAGGVGDDVCYIVPRLIYIYAAIVPHRQRFGLKHAPECRADLLGRIEFVEEGVGAGSDVGPPNSGQLLSTTTCSCALKARSRLIV